MQVQIVLDHYLDKYQTLANTLIDIDFSNLSFLQEKEAIYNLKGHKVSKSYYDKKGKEAIRIIYNRVFSEYQYQEITYPNIFVGVQKTIQYLDWVGEIAYSKNKQFYTFDLHPVYSEIDADKIIDFTSQKQKQILKSERYNADDYLQINIPQVHFLLYNSYEEKYNNYLRTGIKTDLVQTIQTETNSKNLELLNEEVIGYEQTKVKDLIIMNLQ